MTEGVRCRATKLMVRSELCQLSQSDRLLKIGLMSLSSTEKNLLGFPFPIQLNFYTVNMTLMCLVIYNFMNSNMNLTTELMFKSIYARTDTFKCSFFFPRVVRSWNKLTISVKKGDSVSEFKPGADPENSKRGGRVPHPPPPPPPPE